MFNFKWTFVFILGLTACQPKSQLVVLHWQKKSSENDLKQINSINKSRANSVKSLNESIAISEQEFENVKIENSFIKYLKNSNGEFELVDAAYLPMDELQSLNLSKTISEFKKSSNNFENLLKEKIPAFNHHQILNFEPVIEKKNSNYEVLWKISYFDDIGNPFEVKLTKEFQVRSVERVGSGFHELPALVFPKGPKASSLQEVLFSEINTNTQLSNAKVSVLSQAANLGSNLVNLKFNPDDSRFDQVQTFFYLNESIKWFEKNLGLILPFQLSAEVHVGAPDRTNTAFYYDGKIRIGSGDNLNYQKMPQDPSIVIHESVHGLVESVARLPFQGEGGSINEAYADFITALQLDNPRMGEVSWMKGPFRRTVDSQKKLSEKSGGLYGDSAIISGLLWEFKKKFGPEKAKTIAMLTLNRLNPLSDFADFQIQIKEVLPQTLNADELKEAQSILKEREF